MGINAALDSVGESILQWADPENQFRGYTQVCILIKKNMFAYQEISVPLVQRFDSVDFTNSTCMLPLLLRLSPLHFPSFGV